MLKAFPSNNIGRCFFLMSLLLLLLLLGISLWRLKSPALGPEGIVKASLDNLQGARSFAYNLTAVSIIDGKETLLTQVEGIWNTPDRYYLKGETLGNPLESYILGDVYMIKDPQGDWLEFRSDRGPSLLRETVLFSQTPLQDLHGFYSGQLTAQKTTAGQKCYIIEGKLAKVSNPLWQAFWQDFACQLWIDKQMLCLRRLELKGVSMGSDDRLTVHMEIYDYDTQRMVMPPKISENKQ